jgi:polyisoprenyl-phosphate glycosyltransferase
VTEISVVVPVYGCADCLRVLHERLTGALTGIGVPYEIVFVDDAGPDNAWPVLTELARSDPAIKVLGLSRNFGEEAAIAAGLTHASGRYAVVMDCDLQDSPDDVPRLYAKALEGHDIVFTRRVERGHSAFRERASRAYFGLVRRIFKSTVDPEYGNFTMISRKVIDTVLSLRDRDRHYRAILSWVGFRHAEIPVQHHPRHAGESAYDARALFRHAVNGVFFQSATLMRYIVYAGFLFALAGLLLALWFMGSYLFSDYTYPGWTSLAVLLLVSTGFIIVSTGVTGLYIGRIFGQVKGRPLFIVDRAVVEGEELDGPPAPPRADAARDAFAS